MALIMGGVKAGLVVSIFPGTGMLGRTWAWVSDAGKISPPKKVRRTKTEMALKIGLEGIVMNG